MNLYIKAFQAYLIEVCNRAILEISVHMVLISITPVSHSFALVLPTHGIQLALLKTDDTILSLISSPEHSETTLGKQARYFPNNAFSGPFVTMYESTSHI